jgi:hypothetical protein
MSRYRAEWPLIFLAVLLIAVMLLAYFGKPETTVSPIPGRALDEWAVSRFWPATVLALVVGLLWARYLSDSVVHVEAANLNRTARRRLRDGLFGFVALGFVIILVDAWLIYPFKLYHLAFFEALSRVATDWRSMLILLFSSILFFCSGTLYFRFGRAGSLPMRYALWRKPHVE